MHEISSFLLDIKLTISNTIDVVLDNRRSLRQSLLCETLCEWLTHSTIIEVKMIEIDVASNRSCLSVLMVWMRVMSEIRERLVLLCRRQIEPVRCFSKFEATGFQKTYFWNSALFCRRKARGQRCKKKLRVGLLNSSDGIFIDDALY